MLGLRGLGLGGVGCEGLSLGVWVLVLGFGDWDWGFGFWGFGRGGVWQRRTRWPGFGFIKLELLLWCAWQLLMCLWKTGQAMSFCSVLSFEKEYVCVCVCRCVSGFWVIASKCMSVLYLAFRS